MHLFRLAQDGTPRNGYFGTSFDRPIVATAGSKFHPLADALNLYRVAVSDAPLRLTIECFYHEHDPDMTSPYLTVDSIFEAASREEIEKVTGVIGEDDINDESRRQGASMIVKGALVESILQMYFPDATSAQIFALVDSTEEAQKFEGECATVDHTMAIEVNALCLQLPFATVHFKTASRRGGSHARNHWKNCH